MLCQKINTDMIFVLHNQCRQLFYMRRRLRQNVTNVSKIYIGRPIYISNVLHIYPTSGYLYPTSGCLYPTSGCLYKTSGYLYPMSDIYIRRPIYNIRLQLGQGLGQRYRMSDIDIGRLIYILEVRYIYWTSDIDFGNIDGILS